MPIPAHNKHRQRKHLESTRPLDLNLARTLLPAKYPTKKKAKGASCLASFGLLFSSCNLGPDKANPLIRQLGVIRVAVEASGEGKVQGSGRAGYVSTLSSPELLGRCCALRRVRSRHRPQVVSVAMIKHSDEKQLGRGEGLCWLTIQVCLCGEVRGRCLRC